MSVGYIPVNQAAIDQYTQKRAVESAANAVKTAKQAAIKTAQDNLASAKAEEKAVDTQLTNATELLGAQTAQLAILRNTDPVAYGIALPLVTKQQTTVNSLTKKVATAKTKVASAQTALNTLTAPVKKVLSSSHISSIKTALPSGTKSKSVSNAAGPYVYNAPMVFGNNFHGIQADTIDPQYVLPGNYGDAKTAWTNATPSGRGAFQMDRQTNTAEAIAFANKNTFNSTATVPDNTKYGFKFLYNPNTVQMSWGAIMQTDPVFEASGKDEFIPGTANLTSSFIDFSLVLNRIQDFTYLDANGLKNSKDNPYGSFALPQGVATQNAELKKIYEKGTMYDLEYLFKVMHGNGAYVTYNSVLQEGTTADPGWLPVRPIELHLGNKLRYRVRIASLSVSHTIFNARMVPLLSTITLSCARYWDGGGAKNAVIGGKTQ
jgi:hypothetical protein